MSQVLFLVLGTQQWIKQTKVPAHRLSFWRWVRHGFMHACSVSQTLSSLICSVSAWPVGARNTHAPSFCLAFYSVPQGGPNGTDPIANRGDCLNYTPLGFLLLPVSFFLLLIPFPPPFHGMTSYKKLSALRSFSNTAFEENPSQHS